MTPTDSHNWTHPFHHILVCIRTHNKNHDRRALYGDTVLKLPYDPTHLFPYYVFGDAQKFPFEPLDPGLYGIPAVRLPVPDSYDLLPIKTYWMIQWALTLHHWTHLFVCDDDTFFVPERLSRVILTDYPYIGRMEDGWWDKATGWPYASGGAGYFLSRQLAHSIRGAILECILNAPKPPLIPRGAEDVVVGRAVRQVTGNLVQNDPRFIPYGDEELRPLPDNTLISSHRLPLHYWLDSFQAFQTQPCYPS